MTLTSIVGTHSLSASRQPDDLRRGSLPQKTEPANDMQQALSERCPFEFAFPTAHLYLPKWNDKIPAQLPEHHIRLILEHRRYFIYKNTPQLRREASNSCSLTSPHIHSVFEAPAVHKKTRKLFISGWELGFFRKSHATNKNIFFVYRVAFMQINK